MRQCKITVASGSNRITLPKHMVKELGWDEKTVVSAKKVGGKIILQEVTIERSSK